MATSPNSTEYDDNSFTYQCIANLNADSINCAQECQGIYECQDCPCVVLSTTVVSGPGGDVVDVIMCLLPIVFLICVTIKPHNPWPTTVSLPVAAGLLALIRLAYFGSDPVLIGSAIFKGALHEVWTPLSIMAGAIFLFETMQATACLPYVMREMKQLTAGHAVAECMLLFAFAYLVEGASGFGTPVALAAPMLVSSGHAPLESIVVMLLFNTFATVWGAVGTPLWFGLGDSLDVSDAELLDISRKAAAALGVAGFVWIPGILTILIPRPVVRKNLGFVYLSLLVTVGPSAGIAMVNYEFPSLLGGLFGMGFTAVLIRYKVLLFTIDVTDGSNDNNLSINSLDKETGNAPLSTSPVKLTSSTVGSVMSQLPDKDGTSTRLSSGDLEPSTEPVVMVVAMEDTNSHSNSKPSVSRLENFVEVQVMEHDLCLPPDEEYPRKAGTAYFIELLLRTFPIWGVVLLLVLTRLPGVGIQPYLLKTEPYFTIQFGTYGTFRLSVSAVFQLENILTYPGCNWRYELFYVPFIIPFVLISIMTMLFYRRDMSCRPRDVVVTVMHRLKNAAIALAGAMALVQLMIRTGTDSPADILGIVLADWFQEGFVVISPLLGALGSFFSGSTTVSNMTFSNIQYIAAESIGTSTTTMLALQSCGAAAGNGVGLNNIIAACAVVGLDVGEGQIMRRTYKYVLLSTTTATVVMLAFFFRFDG